ncbi:hypothetical protein BCV70DRAFT_28627 [Testicularia cyperi]|uniref:Uncharacterized protein n=1 Tax=Testicularia cyperi TaxID=1882483 RepID=A0A317XKL0_9BASI|nr:hypothetical protein BCV70DRAFT_28627 [Testicularia cyperi]
MPFRLLPTPLSPSPSLSFSSSPRLLFPHTHTHVQGARGEGSVGLFPALVLLRTVSRAWPARFGALTDFCLCIGPSSFSRSLSLSQSIF